MKQQLFLCLMLIFGLTACHNHTEVTDKYPDGSPKRKITFRMNGDQKVLVHETTYYPGKKLQMDGGYNNNQRNGRWVYYYQNGKLWSEGFFKNGRADGKRTTYFESGKVRYEGYFKDDDRVGVWRFYDENGKLLKEINFSAPPYNNKK
ncbi:MAG: toxin-antitoxin system YwqK family antitoxin [Bacteroidota bacterium]|nr:toxin-antitoxin system YwqK family antitoxin [Bacteroidota bacterium]